MKADKIEKRGRGRPALGNIRRNVMFEPDIDEKILDGALKERRNFSNMLNVILRKYFDGEKS